MAATFTPFDSTQPRRPFWFREPNGMHICFVVLIPGNDITRDVSLKSLISDAVSEIIVVERSGRIETKCAMNLENERIKMV